MTDKQVTVAVPEERVPEFYMWFASFLAAEPGERHAWGHPRGRRRGRGPRAHHEAVAWSPQDADAAAWLYGRLAPPARALFDLLIDAPEQRVSGNALASQLGLERGAHGVAGILAWPGRYSRKLGRELPISTEGRDDGGTDYYLTADLARLFAAARASQTSG